MNYNLIGYRNMLRLSQEAMGAKIGMCRDSYQKKENGKLDFTQTEIENIMKILKEKKPLLTIEEVFLRE